MIPPTWVSRCLAVAHFVWGLAMLAVAAWFGTSALRVIPYMSSGSLAERTMGAVLAGVPVMLTAGTLGAWLVLLGRQLWRGHLASIRTALLATHVPLLVFGLLGVWIGLASLKAAGVSAARGGGLMGGLGYIPLAVGTGTAMLALCSISVAQIPTRTRRADDG